MPSSQPLEHVFNKKGASGRIGKWATELSQFEISYVPRTTGQIPSISRFYGRLDTFGTSNPVASTPNLDTLHKWSMGTHRSWGLRRFDSTIRPSHKVCNKTEIQSNK
jgi:hypothetical protein